MAWVRRVAWNLAVSRRRRARAALAALARLHRQPGRRVDGPGPDRVALVAALATLPARQRQVVVLHDLADLPVSEIADQLGVPSGTVKSWLHRARTALAAQLTTTGPAPQRAEDPTRSGGTDDRPDR